MEDLEEQAKELKEITNDLKKTSDKLEEKNENIKKKEKQIEEKDKKLEEKDKKLEEKDEDSKSLSKIKGALAYIGDKVGAGNEQEDQENSYKHKGKEVIFDNIKKGGGSTSDDKDVKNVVVSFF